MRLEGAREPAADVAAPREHHGPNPALVVPELSEDVPDVLARGDEEHLVVHLDHRVAVGDDRPAPAVDGRHPGVHRRQVVAQGPQGVPDEGTAVIRAHRHHEHDAAREFENLEGPRVFDDALDMVGDDLLGADELVDGETPRIEERALMEVGGGADPRDPGRGVEQVECHLAGDHVGLVAVGDREQHVGVLRPRAAQHVGVRREAGQGAEVEVLLEVAQRVRGVVDDGDVIGLAGERCGHRAAHLPGAQDEDLHAVNRPPAGRRSIPSCLSLR